MDNAKHIRFYIDLPPEQAASLNTLVQLLSERLGFKINRQYVMRTALTALAKKEKV